MKSDKELAALHPASGWPSPGAHIDRENKIAQEEPTLPDDSSRIAGRKRVRRNVLAPAVLGEFYSADVSVEIGKVESQSSDVADALAAEIGRFQVEVKTLDRKQIDLIVARKPCDKELAARRRELLSRIYDCRRALSETLKARDARLSDLHEERLELSKLGNVQIAERELFRLGDPDKLQRYHQIRRDPSFAMYLGTTEAKLYEEIVNE